MTMNDGPFRSARVGDYPLSTFRIPRWAHTSLLIALVLVALYSWYKLTTSVIQPALQPSPGTGLLWPNSAYWVAARVVLEGHPDWMYDDARFGPESIRLGADHDIYTANLPTTVLAFLPIGFLP